MIVYLVHYGYMYWWTGNGTWSPNQQDAIPLDKLQADEVCERFGGACGACQYDMDC